MQRGKYKFEVSDDGDPLNTAGNLLLLRKLWLDRKHVKGDDLGPGDPGDFDHGAWHVACHLLGGAGVRKTHDGKIVWLEVSWDAARDRYFASATVDDGGVKTVSLDSAEGRALLDDSTLLGFVEGTSQGRVAARNTLDPPDLFNLWRRQDFDMPPGMDADGGRVWEHWCTLRDIRPTAAIGSSVLTAYLSLVAALGDRFAPTVARGRREYGHPEQLRAMVRAGLIGEGAATWDVTPREIPKNVEAMLQHADPSAGIHAAEALGWGDEPRYYMYARKIAGWSRAKDVKKDLAG